MAAAGCRVSSKLAISDWAHIDMLKPVGLIQQYSEFQWRIKCRRQW